jgi:hypothetical protein
VIKIFEAGRLVEQTLLYEMWYSTKL